MREGHPFRRQSPRIPLANVLMYLMLTLLPRCSSLIGPAALGASTRRSWSSRMPLFLKASLC